MPTRQSKPTKSSMDLLDRLVAVYEMEEDFNRNLRAVNSVPPYSGFSAEHPSSLSLGPLNNQQNVLSAEGKVGRAAEFSFDNVGFNVLSHIDDTTVQGHPDLNTHAFRFDGDRTVSFWIKFRSFHEFGNSIFWKSLPFGGVEYSCHVEPGTNQLVINEAIFHPDVLALSTWYFVLIRYQRTGHVWRIQINNGQPKEGTNAVIASTEPFAIGGDASFDGWIDEFTLWHRILSAEEGDWLYNDGNGRSYDEIVEESSPGPCRELTCCSD